MQRDANEISDHKPVVKIVGIYVLFGCLWILLSDQVLGVFIKEPATIVRMGEYKGVLFIILTSIILFQLISKYVQEADLARKSLKKTNEELEIRVGQRTDELEKRRLDLEKQNRELKETYRRLEQETAERIQALEMLRLKEQLLLQQSRMAAMGEVLGNIAHQWRQPLNVLGLKVQQLGFLYERGELDQELIDASIAKAMEIVLHLSQTIDDFRSFARTDKEKRVFSVDEVVLKTVSMVEDSFREQGIWFEVGSSGNPQINGYANEYAQVVLNILTNARDALLERGVPDPLIRVRSSAEDGKSVVIISDNAGGIREEILDKIFDAYFTTKELGKGTGVGLFMSKTIIEKNMGGTLTVHNVGSGAEFRITV